MISVLLPLRKVVEWLQLFSFSTKIVSGSGARWYLRQLQPKRIFLVTDRFFSENGTAAALCQGLGGTYEIFDQVTPDPTAELAARGTKRLTDFNPDLVIALGGGSPMDCAKSMVFFSKTSAPLAAIPTTSGSGAEVTDFAIITSDGVKKPLVHEALRPRYAILDSDLLSALPKSLIADSGFDVLVHALEAAVGKNSSLFTDAFAFRAFRTAHSLLPASFGGNTAVRMCIHEAAAMAAISFSQAGLGICHALSHALGGQFHVPHGRLNAILIPSVITVNASAAMGKYAALARESGLPGAADTLAVRNLKNSLLRLRRELHLPETLAQAGVRPADVSRNLPAIVEAALADPCCKTNPVEPTPGLLEEVIKEVIGRG